MLSGEFEFILLAVGFIDDNERILDDITVNIVSINSEIDDERVFGTILDSTDVWAAPSGLEI